jgi:hypothetical protein
MTDRHPSLSNAGDPGHGAADIPPPPGGTPKTFSAPNSLRRTVLASRTSGRSAVGLAADPGPQHRLGAPQKPAEKRQKKDQEQSPEPLTWTRSFRNDMC